MIVHSVEKTQPVEPVEPVVRYCNARKTHLTTTGPPRVNPWRPVECRYQLPNRAPRRTSGTRGGAHLPPNVRPHIATVSDEERQHRPPDHAGHAFALEAQQDLQTILRAYFDSL